jgi:hypothetical protein
MSNLKELEAAHNDYLYRRDEIITKLMCIRDSEIENNIMRHWLTQAIEFILEGEV